MRADVRTGTSRLPPTRRSMSQPRDLPIRFDQAINLNAIPLPDKYFGMFLQDDWRLTSKLTLISGSAGTWTCEFATTTRCAARSNCRATSRCGAILDENPGVDWNNVAPRLGFAYG